MLYKSTRGAGEAVPSTRAILRGIAPDGGLYMPTEWKAFPWQTLLPMTTKEMATALLQHFFPEFPKMQEIVEKAYAGKFETEDLTPLVPVGDRYVLELWRGPTSAFKDVALSVLPRLITAAMALEGIRDKLVILTATSGDTGKAALEGFRDVPGTGIIVFYPHGGVSAVQRAQMVTQEGGNVKVCAVRGNFDDAQTGVKKVFAELDTEGTGFRLSSANSINIGRLIPQVVYYFRAYAELVRLGRIRVGDKVDFTVPTGNFGDILAGYFAKKLGLPVGRLLCASNCNCVLTEFLSTGTYDKRRTFFKTLSPSMDILVSSNLERLLYLLTDGDTAQVADWMRQLSEKGCYTVSDALRETLQTEFCGGFADDRQTQKTIGEVWQKHHYLCDTHTAVAWSVAERLGGEAPNVVLSTASPYKFPAAVLEALGEAPSKAEFAVMEQLYEKTGIPIPKNLRGLGDRQERHGDVIDRDAMLSYVRQEAAKL